MAFQPRFGIQPCLSVGIFYSGLYLLENIISFSKLHYYIMFLRTCKAFYEKNIKKFAKYLDFIWFNTNYFLVNDYKVNKMIFIFNLKFFMQFYTHYPRCLIYQKKCWNFYIIRIVQLFSDTFKRLISLPLSFMLDKKENSMSETHYSWQRADFLSIIYNFNMFKICNSYKRL